MQARHSLRLTAGDLDIAARTVWGEVRGHDYAAMVHVARVIVNRAASAHRREWTLAGVCTEPYQFSCWLRNDPNYAKLVDVTLDDPDFRLCHMAVLEAFDMDAAKDDTVGSLHYLVPDIQPHVAWARDKTPVFIDSAHAFFNDVD